MISGPYVFDPCHPEHNAARLNFAWLAGLLEGEGCFLFVDGRPRITLVMTDEDTVNRAAVLMGTHSTVLKKREAHHKVPYKAALSGVQACTAMRVLLPLMGSRRRQRIEEVLALREQAVASHLAKENANRHSREQALLAAWNARPSGQSARAFFKTCSIFKRRVGAPLIGELLTGRSSQTFHVQTPLVPSLFAGGFLSLTAQEQLAWASGLLEGEGHFGSSGVTPTIRLEMTDEDVVGRFAALAEASPIRVAARRAGWQPTHCVYLPCAKAELWMSRLLPWMSTRRTTTIETCLRNRAEWKQSRGVRYAFAPSGSSISRSRKPGPTIGDDKLAELWTSRDASETTTRLAAKLGVNSRTLINTLLRLGVYNEGPRPGAVKFTCTVCGADFHRMAKRGQQACSPSCYSRLKRRRSKTRQASTPAANKP